MTSQDDTYILQQQVSLPGSWFLHACSLSAIAGLFCVTFYPNCMPPLAFLLPFSVSFILFSFFFFLFVVVEFLHFWYFFNIFVAVAIVVVCCLLFVVVCCCLLLSVAVCCCLLLFVAAAAAVFVILCGMLLLLLFSSVLFCVVYFCAHALAQNKSRKRKLAMQPTHRRCKSMPNSGLYNNPPPIDHFFTERGSFPSIAILNFIVVSL